ncbi:MULTISPECIES: hypothetical protein [Nocardia]|uniref:Uncharacterized protein n=1 Tax=Nocardia farcinica (strain IFM 10152) TaxID=247156 RepID=Q5YMG0_NOCFA|nr:MULTISPECIES: hypothetical protein [Nocardia]MBF6253966.1 hypothetical protein [Nocardia farcinica]MBF6271081.1 hypothetical protein [Nocardia farcinica]MBF6308137.1 hypothetical protein [Nocardia farcinica]MBF6410800.1 hypothetical protein [Nocardia farcinica]MBF6511617.1 hypothetical protein [Nocardia farcinica]
MADTQSDAAGGRRWSRENFSCSDEVWGAAKKKWGQQLRQYPTWTGWLEAALAEKTARTRQKLGISTFEPAPDRLPPGRRTPPDQAGTRPRRSFSCSVEVWQDARNAWWAEAESYPAWSDWAEEAVAEKAESDERSTQSESTEDKISSKTS